MAHSRGPVCPAGGQLHYRLTGTRALACGPADPAVVIPRPTVDSGGTRTYATFRSSKLSPVAPELGANPGWPRRPAPESRGAVGDRPAPGAGGQSATPPIA